MSDTVEKTKPVERQIAGLRRDQAGWTTSSEALIVRLGIASLFVINGITALMRPEEFQGVIAANPILGSLPDVMQQLLIRSAAVHDFGISFLLVQSRRDRIAVLWMSAWVASIAITKATTLLFG